MIIPTHKGYTAMTPEEIEHATQAILEQERRRSLPFGVPHESFYADDPYERDPARVTALIDAFAQIPAQFVEGTRDTQIAAVARLRAVCTAVLEAM